MTDPARFAARYPFALDGFQMLAIEALADGESVLVAAPTGAGKTVVAEFAVDRALDLGRKCFYTTPLKALSNQKFGDFVARLGAAKVGLLTGDNAINGDAPVVVMTTEVLRNMLYERSDALDGLVTVVMDEVHYLQDPYRGGVWEEVLIHLPMSASVVCLSATISNAEEFGEWIGTLRGPTRVVIEERRPIPLEHHYLVGRDLHPMHVDQDGSPGAEPVHRLPRPSGGPVQDLLPAGFAHATAPPHPSPARRPSPRLRLRVARTSSRRCATRDSCRRSTSSSAARDAIGASSGSWTRGSG